MTRLKSPMLFASVFPIMVAACLGLYRHSELSLPRTVARTDLGSFLLAATNWNLAWLLLIASLAVACVTDTLEHRIRNWVTYPLVGWALLSAAIGNIGQVHFSEQSLFGAIAGAVVCFGVMSLIYRQGGCGAGDVKLAAGIGAVLGSHAGINVMMLCNLTAAMFLVVLLLQQFVISFWSTRHELKRVWRDKTARRVLLVQPVKHVMREPIPMAVFFAVGFVLEQCNWNLI